MTQVIVEPHACAPAAHYQRRAQMLLGRATIELRQYRRDAAGDGLMRPGRCMLDLALSPRPGTTRGRHLGSTGTSRRSIGSLLYIPAHETLSVEWGPGGQTSIHCEFDGPRPDDATGGYDPAELDASIDVRSAFVRGAMVRLARELETPGFCSEFLANAIWVELAVELGRYLRRERTAVAAPEGGLSSAQLRRIEEWIEEPGILPPVAEMARSCGMSARHFFRLFRSTTGKTLSCYAAEKRIERARALLGGSRRPVKEIAWRCGFETPAAFSAAFRRAVGVTPREYRQTMLH